MMVESCNKEGCVTTEFTVKKLLFKKSQDKHKNYQMFSHLLLVSSGRSWACLYSLYNHKAVYRKYSRLHLWHLYEVLAAHVQADILTAEN